MKAVIIDDEVRAVKTIELALNQYCPDVRVVGKAYNAQDGLTEILKQNPDLVFLDIEMPHTTGIELLESIPDKKFDVIFVTGYNEYAIKAFRLNAVDYLLKPLNVLELIEAVKRVKDKSKNHLLAQQKIEQVTKLFSDKFPVVSLKGTEYIILNDIIRFQADGSYSKIYTLHNKAYTISRNLKEVEDILNAVIFFRIHKSHIINIHHIKKISPHKDGGEIVMADDSVVEIARSRKIEFFKFIERIV